MRKVSRGKNAVRSSSPCLTESESELFWNKGLTWWNSKRNVKSRSSINEVSRSRLWAGITCYISKHSLVCLSYSIYELQIVKVILQLGYNMVYIIIKGGNSVVYLVVRYTVKKNRSKNIYGSSDGTKILWLKKMIILNLNGFRDI